MAVRLVRKLLAKKRKRSLKRGRDVEATVCQRAVETLNGYEKQMTAIKTKMSEALQQQNVEEVNKLVQSNNQRLLGQKARTGAD